MTSHPNPGYTEHHDLTVFVTWAKSRWTWDFKNNRPLAFWSNREAEYANYQCNRRLRKMAKKRKWRFVHFLPVTSHSANNPCITVPQKPYVR